MLITCPHCKQQSEHATELRFRDIVLEVDTLRLSRDRKTVRLTRTETMVIAALMRAGEHGLPMEDLRPIVYRERPNASQNCLSMAVGRSREKLAALRADIPKSRGDAAAHRYRIVVQP